MWDVYQAGSLKDLQILFFDKVVPTRGCQSASRTGALVRAKVVCHVDLLLQHLEYPDDALVAEHVIRFAHLHLSLAYQTENPEAAKAPTLQTTFNMGRFLRVPPLLHTTHGPEWAFAQMLHDVPWPFPHAGIIVQKCASTDVGSPTGGGCHTIEPTGHGKSQVRHLKRYMSSGYSVIQITSHSVWSK
jgi:hypothetical protein